MEAAPVETSVPKMTAAMFEKACEILRLSAQISESGLAHSFVDMSGHVRRFTARTLPADTRYSMGSSYARVSEVDVSFDFEDMSPAEQAGRWRGRMARLCAYAEWLQQVIDKAEVITTAESVA